VVKNYPQALNGLAAPELPISGAVARQAGLLEVEHRDPFDRLLAAQAMADDLLLASSDLAFRLFPNVALLS
jgi:PIN domain nuclease of toxin-antitoxin system